MYHFTQSGQIAILSKTYPLLLDLKVPFISSACFILLLSDTLNHYSLCFSCSFSSSPGDLTVGKVFP